MFIGVTQLVRTVASVSTWEPCARGAGCGMATTLVNVLTSTSTRTACSSWESHRMSRCSVSSSGLRGQLKTELSSAAQAVTSGLESQNGAVGSWEDFGMVAKGRGDL